MAPANAAPMFTPKAPAIETGVIQVQADSRADQRAVRRLQRQAWRDERRAIRRGGFYSGYRDRDGWYNGHRGYRHYRPGYHRHGDFWFPLAAFAAGAIISGAIQDRPVVRYRGGNAHVEWCYDRYRSYRAYDNTFQPYHGGRRQCYSPYS
jgi:hypothetical protein